MDPIQASIKHAIQQYFVNLEGAQAANIYSMVMSQVERHLLDAVMEHAQRNQSRATKWLGISRNTLRKLIEKYGLTN